MAFSLRQRATWRFYLRHPWQLWLSILSIALGAAVVVAVDMANHSARQAFSLSLDALTGRATHQIVAGPQGLDEQLYRKLRVDMAYHQSAPVVQGAVVVAAQSFTLLGIEPFAERMFRQVSAEVSKGQLRALLTVPNALVMSEQRATQLGLSLGAAVAVEHDGQVAEGVLVATFAAQQSTTADWLIADISSAQHLLNKLGVLDRIDVILTAAEAQALQSQLPPNVNLQQAGARQGALTQMTRAFHLNLSALSLLALVVGSFLVYNTMTFAVLQRRSQFATQRMLGVTGRQLFIQILSEAVIFGLIAGGLGLLLGVLLGHGLLQLVTRTINDLYFSLTVSQLYLQPSLFFKGLAVTVVATSLAALGPAFEAAKISPVAVMRHSHLEQQTRRWLPTLALAGLALIAFGLLLTQLASRSLLLGFIALFLLIVGYSLSIPWLAGNVLLRLAERLPLHSIWWNFAIRGVRTGLSRTGLAIAALAVAVSATVGVSMMISSFRASVDDWLNLTLQSDVFIAATDTETLQGRVTIPKDLIQQVGALDGVASWSAGWSTELELNHVPTKTLILKPGAHSAAGFDIIDRGKQKGAAWQGFLSGDILVSEPLAFHQQLQRGDALSFLSPQQGQVTLTIAGIYRDYSSSHGALVLHADHYAKDWQPVEFASLGLKLDEAKEADVIEAAERIVAQSELPLKLTATREIRERSLDIFDRTFAITHVLRLLAIVVAFVGVFSALMALIMERQREYAVYRSIGVTPTQLQGMIMCQSVVVGVLAGILALPLGWAMSELLIQVINQRAFGWTMARHIPWAEFVQAILLSALAASLAGIWPALKMRRMQVARSLREE